MVAPVVVAPVEHQSFWRTRLGPPRDMPAIVMTAGKITAGVATFLALAHGFPVMAAGSYFLLVTTHIADYQFGRARNFRLIVEGLEQSTQSLEQTTEKLKARDAALRIENTRFRCSNQQLQVNKQDLIRIVQDVRQETARLADLREGNSKLFEDNQGLTDQLLQTTKKLQTVEGLISAQITKLRGSSSSIGKDTETLKKEQKQLRLDIKRILRQTLPKTPQPSTPNSKTLLAKKTSRTVKTLIENPLRNT